MECDRWLVALVGATRDGFSYCLLSCFFLAKSRNTPTQRTIAQETIPKAKVPQTSCTSEPRSLCGTDAVWISHSFFVCRRVVLFLRRENTSSSQHVQGSITVDDVQPALRLYDRCGLGCVCFCDRRAALKNVVVCTSAQALFML